MSGARGRGRAAAPVAARPRVRVLTVSHGHPAFTRGGAEIAAYALHRALLADGGTGWFLGVRPRDAPERLGAPITQPFGALDYVYAPGVFDWFKFANRDPAFPGAFAALLRELRPDVVHFHHFALVGIEALAIARAALPGVRIVLTAHEYLLICHAYGQMVTRPDEQLCRRATLADCHGCFPEHSQADFWLRGAYLRRFLAEVDAFIAPSRFLAGRLVEWGVPAERLQVIENLVEGVVPGLPEAGGDGRLRVGFFGQVSRLKGTSVLLEAAGLLDGDAVAIEIHGTYAGQPPELQEEFRTAIAVAPGHVRYHGGYRPEEVDGLMRGVDVVVAPSIWWENSPIVIQEAFRNGRPVICSDIGGMREKVTAGVDGWHVPVGDARALALLLGRLAADRGLVSAMALGARAGDAGVVLRAHLGVYSRASAPRPSRGLLR